MSTSTKHDSNSTSHSSSKSKSKSKSKSSHSKKSKRKSSRHNKKNMRTIGRWYIGETLGKGGYSWVKKGYDKKTGKCVALKFMAKADESWLAEQSKQVVTEIESLKQIRHPNVMKLYAYNLNAKYPSKTDEKLDTILLVLEYAPGGELFDILYYTSALEEIVSRSYFRQIIAGLEACHNAGVAHRDLKPQNLLLDSRFNLKITDFGLSKVFESDADAIMKTTYVGTRGYQAPELLLDRSYDLSCDIFSIGVVLFILLTGYPPFEQAAATDRWYRPLTKKDFERFWKAHRGCLIAEKPEAKDLVQRMLAYDPKDRITIAEIKKHAWYNDKYLQGKDLIRALRNRHREMEHKRRKDAKKIEDLQNSIKPKKDVDFGETLLRTYPSNEVESVLDTHTTTHWHTVYNMLEAVIAGSGISGETIYDQELQKMTCTVKLGQSPADAADAAPDASEAGATKNEVIKFEVEVVLSKEFNTPEIMKQVHDQQEKANEIIRQINTLEALKAKALENADNDVKDNSIDDQQQELREKLAQQDEETEKVGKGRRKPVYVVRIKRLEGSVIKFNKVKKGVIFNQCAGVFTGLPKWARKELENESKQDENNDQQNEDNNNNNDDDDDQESESEDYDKLLDQEGIDDAQSENEDDDDDDDGNDNNNDNQQNDANQDNESKEDE